jgi:hypothetical protein
MFLENHLGWEKEKGEAGSLDMSFQTQKSNGTAQKMVSIQPMPF